MAASTVNRIIGGSMVLALAVWGSAEARAEKVGLGHHDFLIPVNLPPADPNLDRFHKEESHWSWVQNAPTDFPVLTMVTYFIHNVAHVDDDGIQLTAAQEADLNTAAATWNASGANVELVQVLADNQADIHVHMDGATTFCQTNNNLGCAEFTFTAHQPLSYPAPHPDHYGPHAGGFHDHHRMISNLAVPFSQELTMRSTNPNNPGPLGIPWYSGVAGGIGGAQLDFLTVAIQEFGHHLGLGHPDENGPHGDSANSPMNSLLTAGDATNRALVQSDINALVHLYGLIPEPGTLALLGIAGLAARRGRRRRGG